MGNNRESEQKETLDELAGHADSTRQLPLSMNEHINLLKKEYNLNALIRENAITRDGILFLAEMRCEIDSYSYATGIDEISPDAVVGASAIIGDKYGKTSIYVRRKYEDLLSIIHMCKRSKQ